MAGELQTFFLAMLPLGELRASIPVALAVYNLNWFWALFISVLGNLVPPVLILLFLSRVSAWLSKHFAVFEKFFNWLFTRTRRDKAQKVAKYGPFALFLFTAIPLPFTGAWTAALVAFVFGVPIKKALPFIAGGIFIAGIIVLLLFKMGISIAGVAYPFK